jgi:glutaredoxin
MNLTLIISDNCAACERAKETLRKIQLNYPQVLLEIININFLNDRSISITPALLVNNQLFSYGDIDEPKLYRQMTLTK